MPRAGSPYGGQYERARRQLLGLPCHLQLVCRGAPADSADHVPALSAHRHVEGSGCCVLRPACRRCQNVQGAELSNGRPYARLYRRGRFVGRRRLPSASRAW